MKKRITDLFKIYTPEELADAFIFPSTLTKKEKEESDKAFSEFLKNYRAKMSESERLEMKLIALKYRLGRNDDL